MGERKQLLETLSDAQDEIALADADEGGIKLLLGESYIDVDEETADDFLTKRIEELEEALSSTGEEVEALEKRQITLMRNSMAASVRPSTSRSKPLLLSRG